MYSNCSKKPYSYLVHAAGCRYGKSGVRRSVPSCAYNTQHVNFLTILLNGLSPERKTTLSEERSSSTIRERNEAWMTHKKINISTAQGSFGSGHQNLYPFTQTNKENSFASLFCAPSRSMYRARESSPPILN